MLIFRLKKNSRNVSLHFSELERKLKAKIEATDAEIPSKTHNPTFPIMQRLTPFLRWKNSHFKSKFSEGKCRLCFADLKLRRLRQLIMIIMIENS